MQSVGIKKEQEAKELCTQLLQLKIAAHIIMQSSKYIVRIRDTYTREAAEEQKKKITQNIRNFIFVEL